MAGLIEELMQAGETRQLDAGDVLCQQGDDSDSAYVLSTGELETVVSTDEGDVVLATHGPGSLVGEVTALVGGMRTATLRATGPTEVRIVSTVQLREIFNRHPDESAHITATARDRTDRSRVARLLAEELGGVDEAAIAAITELVTWRNVSAGELLFNAGDPADAAYIVLAGRLEVEAPDGRRLALVGRGSVVGEFGLLEGRPRTATIRAVRDTNLARLSQQDFASIAVQHTNLAMGLIRRILDRAGQESAAATLTSRSACVVLIDDDHRDVIPEALTTTLAGLGSTARLGPAQVDDLLGATGASDAQPGEIGDVRLAELLHQVEVDHDHLLLEADLGRPAWTARALRRADQVVIFTPPHPSSEQADRIRQTQSMVPDTTPVWLVVVHPPGTDRPRRSAQMAKRFGVDEIHHVRGFEAADLARVARLTFGRGIAVVLGGGGARGFAHIGVIRLLEELGVPIDRIAGSSMGAVIGGGVAQGVADAERPEVVRKQFAKVLDYTLPLVSLVSGQRATASIQDQFGQWDIEDLWLPFSCVTTNLTESKVVKLRNGPLDLAIRASTAIPGVLPPVPHNGDLLIDGGVLDNLPISLVADDPSIETVIAVDVAPPEGPRAKSDYGMSVSGWSVLASRVRRSGDAYPGLTAVLMRTMLVAAARDRDEAVAAGKADLYLLLELRGIGLLEFEAVDLAVDRGYKAAKDEVTAWWRQHRSQRAAAIDEP